MGNHWLSTICDCEFGKLTQCRFQFQITVCAMPKCDRVYELYDNMVVAVCKGRFLTAMCKFIDLNYVLELLL